MWGLAHPWKLKGAPGVAVRVPGREVSSEKDESDDGRQMQNDIDMTSNDRQAHDMTSNDRQAHDMMSDDRQANDIDMTNNDRQPQNDIDMKAQKAQNKDMKAQNRDMKARDMKAQNNTETWNSD